MTGTHIHTGRKYAVKVLDKSHLMRNNKLQTALVEKNALVKLGSGHPGVVRLYYTFHDEWSLCESGILCMRPPLSNYRTRLCARSRTERRNADAYITPGLSFHHLRTILYCPDNRCHRLHASEGRYPSVSALHDASIHDYSFKPPPAAI